jgi:hypothetical protein
MAMFFSLIMMLALPLIASAQGRGYGRGRGNNQWRKCGKFVNCHDARDGRWDRSRGSRIGNRFYNRRNRVRFDRDGDGDFDRNDRRRWSRRDNRHYRWQVRTTRRNSRYYR